MTRCACTGDRCRMEPDDPRHGTDNGYSNLHCRCQSCRTANAIKQRDDRARRATVKVPDHVHGTPNGYGNWRCRCDECRRAWRLDTQVQRHRAKNNLTDVARGICPGPTPVPTEGH